MSQSLSEYIDSLYERSDIIWPSPLDRVPLKVTPFLEPMEEIKAVLWEPYGTLLRVDLGKLIHDSDQQLRMKVALEKTIDEFNMWYSMVRKPGQPWEYMLRQYRDVVQDLGMKAVTKGEIPEIDSTQIWIKLIDRLIRNEYEYDEGTYGDLEHFAQKVAYFFHASLQGIEAADEACETLKSLSMHGVRQGLLCEGQAFTIPQVAHKLSLQLPIQSMSEVLSLDCCTLSYRTKVKKPSAGMFTSAIDKLKSVGIAPEQALYVSHRLKDDLAIAKTYGLRTCLFAANKNDCEFTGEDVRNPDYKPDRLVSKVRQIRLILGV